MMVDLLADIDTHRLVQATWALAAVTFLLVVAGVMQWLKLKEHSAHFEDLATQTTTIAKAAMDNADAARRAVLMQFRPRLVIVDVFVTGKELSQMTLSFALKNVGPATARLCATVATVKPGGSPVPVEGSEYACDVNDITPGLTCLPVVHMPIATLPEQASNLWVFVAAHYIGELGDEHVVRATYASGNHFFTAEGEPLKWSYQRGWDCDT